MSKLICFAAGDVFSSFCLDGEATQYHDDQSIFLTGDGFSPKENAANFMKSWGLHLELKDPNAAKWLEDLELWYTTHEQHDHIDGTGMYVYLQVC